VTGRERLDTDTRIFRAHVETRSLCHNIKKHFHTTQTHKNVCDCSECVCECVIASKARSRRARQLMGGVNGPNSRVHIWQTLKQVVVQRCGLTSDRKAAPRPPAPAHPRQSQYMWTLKMHASGIHLQDRSRTCAAQDARSFELLCAFVAALLPRAAS
jgi:hypothetical protein